MKIMFSFFTRDAAVSLMQMIEKELFRNILSKEEAETKIPATTENDHRVDYMSPSTSKQFLSNT